MYVYLQPGQDTLLRFKLQLDKRTWDELMYKQWENLFEKEIRLVEIMRYGTHDIKTHQIINCHAENSLDNFRIKSLVEKTNNNCRNYIDDPCDTVNIIFEHFTNDIVTDSNSIDYRMHKLMTLKFHRESNILEIVPIRSCLGQEANEDYMYWNYALQTFFSDDKMILYRFSLELIGDIAALDSVEALLEMKSKHNLQNERHLMIMGHRVRGNKCNITEMIQIEILSAHGFEADNLRISFQVSTSNGWRAKLSDATFDKRSSGEVFYGQTEIANCAILSMKTLVTFLVVTIAGLYAIAFKIQVIRFSVILFAVVVISHEAGRISQPRLTMDETLKATFSRAITLQKTEIESKANICAFDNLKVLFIVSTNLENVESIVSFGTLHVLPEMNDFKVHLPTLRISSISGMPKWWFRLYEYFLGSPVSRSRIIQLLLDGSNNIKTQSCGIIKLRIRHLHTTQQGKI